MGRHRLSEYDDAYQSVVGRAIDGFVAAHDFLGQIRRAQTQHTGPTRNVREPQVLDQQALQAEVSALIDKAALAACDVDTHTAFVFALAGEHVATMMKLVLGAIGAVSDAAGTSRDAQGRKLDWDLILDLMEEMELEFDDEGAVRPPTLVVHPRALDGLRPMTREQLVRREAILAEKLTEHVATKPTRRLPR